MVNDSFGGHHHDFREPIWRKTVAWFASQLTQGVHCDPLGDINVCGCRGFQESGPKRESFIRSHGAEMEVVVECGLRIFKCHRRVSC